MIDSIFKIAFESADTAIFDVGSVMAVLMLVFGILDYKYGEKLRQFIVNRKLDKPLLMAGLALIPVDGTLLFQYNAYRRGSIRFGSLVAGCIGIGEEATYLVMSYQPLTWLILAGTKLIAAAVIGGSLNGSRRLTAKTASLRVADQAAGIDEDAVKADENFHELPDKFRHRLHHFRYHTLGKAFWIFFASAFAIELLMSLLIRLGVLSAERLTAMGIPFLSWLAMASLLIVLIYHLVCRLTTREFGKIYEYEFQDLGDAVGDLAETCAKVILLIFIVTFLVKLAIGLIGAERIGRLFAGRGLLAVLAGALIGLIPGTGASLSFTALYFTLQGTGGALPFASLAACSIALIGDSQFIGASLIRKSQRVAHIIIFAAALLIGGIIYFIETLIR